jgi:hypothetical protein
MRLHLKRIPKRYIWLIAGILIGLAIALPAYAKKPEQTLVFKLTHGPSYTLRPEIKKEDPSKLVASHETSNSHSRRNSRAAYQGQDYSKEEVQQFIKDYSESYGISADTPLRIARCESGFNQYAKNKSSTASGVFQYLSQTWANTPEGRNGLSVFDADANVRAAVRHIAVHGTVPWLSSKHCWNV